MEITVLGKSPSWQDVGGACSGYLVREGDFVLLLDCGNGVFSKLRELVDYVDVSAVLISHLHADHFLDLVPFSYALSYAPRQQPVPVAGWPGTERPARPQLYAPVGAQDFFRRVVGCWGNEDADRERVLAPRVRHRPTSSRSARSASASARCRTTRRPTRSSITTPAGGG